MSSISSLFQFISYRSFHTIDSQWGDSFNTWVRYEQKKFIFIVWYQFSHFTWFIVFNVTYHNVELSEEFEFKETYCSFSICIRCFCQMPNRPVKTYRKFYISVLCIPSIKNQQNYKKIFEKTVRTSTGKGKNNTIHQAKNHLIKVKNLYWKCKKTDSRHHIGNQQKNEILQRNGTLKSISQNVVWGRSRGLWISLISQSKKGVGT